MLCPGIGTISAGIGAQKEDGGAPKDEVLDGIWVLVLSHTFTPSVEKSKLPVAESATDALPPGLLKSEIEEATGVPVLKLS